MRPRNRLGDHRTQQHKPRARPMCQELLMWSDPELPIFPTDFIQFPLGWISTDQDACTSIGLIQMRFQNERRGKAWHVNTYGDLFDAVARENASSPSKDAFFFDRNDSKIRSWIRLLRAISSTVEKKRSVPPEEPRRARPRPRPPGSAARVSPAAAASPRDRSQN